MSGNYIHDGYTEQGYIAEVERLHKSLAFEFRPLKYDEREAVMQKVRSESPAAQTITLAGIIARQVKSWDAVDENGQPLDVRSIPQIRRLKPPVFAALYDIIACYRPSDPLPEERATPDALEEELNTQLFGIEGKSEADAKN